MAYRIVGFEVEPQSIQYDTIEKLENDRCEVNTNGIKVMELKNSSE